MLLNDKAITSICAVDGMISPFIGHQVRTIDDKPCISYGLSSAGYDIRLGVEFMQFRRAPHPKPVDPHALVHDMDGWTQAIAGQVRPFALEPGDHVLGVSVEAFRMPRDVVGVCVGKSTYARCGVIVNVTPLEPGWCGHLTIELHNASLSPVLVYPMEGIAQVQFQRIDDPAVAYDQRGGKYQSQPARPVAPRI